MSFGALIPSEIWHLKSEIWPDFPKSEILSKSGIWLFLFSVRHLSAQLQISDGGIRNLIRNLDYPFNINSFCQIPDFGKSTPKGVGGLPATGGESHHLPPGKFRAHKSRPKTQSDDGGRYRQASTAVVFHPSSPPEEETTHG